MSQKLIKRMIRVADYQNWLIIFQIPCKSIITIPKRLIVKQNSNCQSTAISFARTRRTLNKWYSICQYHLHGFKLRVVKWLLNPFRPCLVKNINLNCFLFIILLESVFIIKSKFKIYSISYSLSSDRWCVQILWQDIHIFGKNNLILKRKMIYLFLLNCFQVMNVRFIINFIFKNQGIL